MFKEEANAINNNKDDEVKAEAVGLLYIGDECKDLIDIFFKYGLMDGDLHLTNFNSQKKYC